MFCPNCGKELPEGAKFCGECGASISVPPENSAPDENATPKIMPNPEQTNQNVSQQQSAPQQKQPPQAYTPVNNTAAPDAGVSPASASTQSAPQSQPVQQQTQAAQTPTKGSGKNRTPLIIGIVVVIIVVILAIVMFSGGSSDSDDEMETTAAERTIASNVIDLSRYLGYTEDELVEEFGFTKNQEGFYPDFDNYNFMCLDDVVMISIDADRDNDGKYTIFGIGIGTKESDISGILGHDFTYSEKDSYDFDGESFLWYDDTSGGVLMIWCGTDGLVESVDYMSGEGLSQAKAAEQAEVEDESEEEEADTAVITQGERKSNVDTVATLVDCGESSDVKFSVSDEQKDFINGHPNLFPAEEEDFDELVGYFDRSMDHAHVIKNPQRYSGSFGAVFDLTVTQAWEESLTSAEYDNFSVFNAVDSDLNCYMIYYTGKSVDVVAGDVIDTVAMPIDYVTYESLEGNTVFSLIMMASIVENDNSPELLMDFIVNYALDDAERSELFEEVFGEDIENASDFDPENIDYARAYAYAFSAVGPAEYGSYSLWDLNDDGIAELILGHGEYSADYVNDIWTLDSNGNILSVGILDSEQTFYVAPDGNGIYAVYGHMGHEIITRLTMSGDKLYTEIVRDRELDMAAGEEYYSSEMRIAWADLDDESLLQIWSNMSGSNNNEYILPDSDSRYYSASELSGYTKDELRIARNEIYARHGRMFDSADLNEYFNSKSWYNGTVPAAQFNDNVLNDYEKENAKTIQSVENSMQ